MITRGGIPKTEVITRPYPSRRYKTQKIMLSENVLRIFNYQVSKLSLAYYKVISHNMIKKRLPPSCPYELDIFSLVPYKQYWICKWNIVVFLFWYVSLFFLICSNATIWTFARLCAGWLKLVPEAFRKKNNIATMFI